MAREPHTKRCRASLATALQNHTFRALLKFVDKDHGRGCILNCPVKTDARPTQRITTRAGYAYSDGQHSGTDIFDGAFGQR